MHLRSWWIHYPITFLLQVGLVISAVMEAGFGAWKSVRVLLCLCSSTRVSLSLAKASNLRDAKLCAAEKPSRELL